MPTWWSRLLPWLRTRSQPAPDLKLGARGERIAAEFLRRQGMTIVGQNVKLGRGEIDLIVVDGRTIVFVEVKTRVSMERGHPLEAITPAKQRQLTRLALMYLKRNRLLEQSVRFDAIGIVWTENGEPEICHRRNAFASEWQQQFYA